MSSLLKSGLLAVMFLSTSALAQNQWSWQSAQCWNDGPTFPGVLVLTIERSVILSGDEVFQLIADITESSKFSVQAIYTATNVQSIEIIRNDYKKYRAPHTHQFTEAFIQENDRFIDELHLKHPEISGKRCSIKSCGSVRVGGCK